MARSKAVSELIAKIKAQAEEKSEKKPKLTAKQAEKLATQSSTLSLGAGAEIRMVRQAIGEPEVVRGSIEEAAKKATEALRQMLKDRPELKAENLQAQMIVMDGDSEQGTKYHVNVDGSYNKVENDEDGISEDFSSFPTHSAIELMKVLDKRLKDGFGGQKHKDIELPDDPRQADIMRVINKLHKQRHEQVDTLIELLAAVATYEAVAEQSPSEITKSGDLKAFIKCCNVTILQVMKDNGSICTMFHALEHIEMPGHSKLEMSTVN